MRKIYLGETRQKVAGMSFLPWERVSEEILHPP